MNKKISENKMVGNNMNNLLIKNKNRMLLGKDRIE